MVQIKDNAGSWHNTTWKSLLAARNGFPFREYREVGRIRAHWARIRHSGRRPDLAHKWGDA